LRCDAAARVFTLDPHGGAVAIRVWAPNGSSHTITPGGFIDSGGRAQAHPDMSTRGVWVRSAGERTFTEGVSRRIWLDVFPDVP
jgi:hypothetical protein